jgi:nucleotide-binding universal stress UspA family protein
MRIKSILCPIDFSPASLRALDYAIELAQNYSASLNLLNVVSPVIPSSYEFPIDLGKLLASIEKDARARMQRLKKTAMDAGVRATADVRVGEIRIAIDDAVRKRDIDMVVMGKHSRSGIERWFMGSVTERLLRLLPVPILIVSEGKPRKHAPPTIRRIVTATDLSDRAADVVAYSTLLAQDADATVELLYVAPQAAGIDLPYEAPVDEVRAKLERLVPAAARNSGKVTARITTGIPYKEILDRVGRTRPDLLVIGIHGKSRLERALLGSIAERVIRGATCPVLAVPPKRVSVARTSTRKRVA